MRISEEGLALIRESEGYRPTAYPDPGSDLARATRDQPWGWISAPEIRARLPVATQLLSGKPWTIGYGTTVYPSGAPVQPGDTCTQAEAEAWLQMKVEGFGRGVLEALERPQLINQSIFDALTSIAYNIGTAALTGSTLMRKINAGDWLGAAAEFDRWNLAGGRVEPGLVKRRDREQALFERGLDEALAFAAQRKAEGDNIA
ncbi:MAG TPA: lysozyme [Casimicrobiaceae bacterium]|nr:lysozyme [Casimicrobiaceae bacterium]